MGVVEPSEPRDASGETAPRLASRLLQSSTFRLGLIYAVLFSASVMLLLGFIYWSTAGFMARQTDATIRAEIDALAERYQFTSLQGLIALIKERIERNPAGGSIYLLTDARYQRLVGNLDRWPKVEADAQGWLVFDLRQQTAEGVIEHPARARAFVLPEGLRLLVGRDIRELTQTESLLIRSLAWGVGITVLLALGGGVFMSRSTARRIEAINDTAREIMHGELAMRVPVVGSDDEFDRLATNLNAMLDRIEQLMDDARRVSDNIAHDLRTPLTRLRARLEALTRAPETNSQSTEEALAEADGLLETFNALLRIARVESDRRRAGFGELELESLVDDVIELYEPLAHGRDQQLRITSSGPVHMVGDRDLLFQAFANVIDNAVKYTPRGGSILVRLEGSPAGTTVTIADTGPGIPAEAREQVLQRFFRLHSARSEPGNGLGLSLVAAVAKLHGAKLTLGGDESGLEVRLEFPA